MPLPRDTPTDFFAAVDAALEEDPTRFRALLEEWQASLNGFDRGFIDAQKLDFVTSLCTPLVCGAVEVWSPGDLHRFPSFALKQGSAWVHAIGRNPEMLADVRPDADPPWAWLPALPAVAASSRAEVERQCPKLFGIDVLRDWPELQAVDMDPDLLRSVAKADPATPPDWGELYQRCAHQQTATPDAFRVMPFLLAHRQPSSSQPTTWDVDIVLSIGGVALAEDPNAPWVDEIRAVALERLPQLDDPYVGLFSIPQIFGHPALAERLWPALDPDPEDHVLYCPHCDHEIRPTWKGREAPHPVAQLLAKHGQRAWARRVRWLAAADCPDCEAPLLDGVAE